MLKNLKLKKRNYKFFDELLNLNKIISFIGPRRVGKTYLMFQFALELIEKGFLDYNQVVFIDFSIFKGEIIKAEDIIESYYALGYDKPPFFIFDEIQDIENWQQLILTLYTQGYKIFISGSNSKLLSSELVTEFRGRVFEYFVYPLTFEEILVFNEFELEEVYSSIEEGKLKRTFVDIFKFGTFPEVVLVKDEMLKIELLKTYFDILFYKDLLERYKIENEKAMRFLMKRLILNNTKQLRLIKIFNEIKSKGIKLGKNTIYEYFEYLKNIFFLDEINNFYKKVSKIYLFNFGFGYLFGYTDNLGINFENFIYWNLKRKYKKVYYKANGGEIDFYVEDEDLNIQVCYQLNDLNKDREVKPLLKQEGKRILVYFEKLTSLDIDKIKFMDLFEFGKFLLTN